MDIEPGSNNSSSGGPANPTNNRKERGAIAAQACENCRQRKQRCSEERPACATCLRMKLDCKYREAQPTKKDKTLLEILDRLKSLKGDIRNLDGKVDNLNIRGAIPLSVYGPIQSNQAHGPPPVVHESSRSNSWPSSSLLLDTTIDSSLVPQLRYYEYAPAAYKMLLWPTVQPLLENVSLHVSLASLQRDGSSILGLQTRPLSLPVDGLGMAAPRQEAGPHLSVSGPPEVLQLSSLALSWEAMVRLSKAYFDTFNLLYPIMDRYLFQRILQSVAGNGFDDGMNSTLVCLVLALGEVATASIQGEVLTTYKGRPGGIRGGTLETPPGLALFNEARKRLGFNLTECSLENVQIFALAAMYYETCFHHTEFWRMATSASLACQALLTSNPEELTSPQADHVRAELIRRIFWHCSTIETYLNLEFNLSLTGLDKFEELVGPAVEFSSGLFLQEDYISNQTPQFEALFVSQLALRTLFVEFHGKLANVLGAAALATGPAADSIITTVIATLKGLAAQLDEWRGMLPMGLRWQDEQRGTFSNTNQDMYGGSVYPPPGADGHTNFLTEDLDDAPVVSYPYTADILTAMLRTRYYHLKYLLHRPFLYKALHYPENMTREDAEGVAICLKSILLWPITMSPVRGQKRLIPCLFFWSQNLLSILLVLHLSQQVPILRQIRENLLDDRFEMDAKETTRLCIDWLRDLKGVEATALWCWTVLEGFHPVEV